MGSNIQVWVDYPRVTILPDGNLRWLEIYMMKHNSEDYISTIMAPLGRLDFQPAEHVVYHAEFERHEVEYENLPTEVQEQVWTMLLAYNHR